MKAVKKLQNASKSILRFVVNGVPTNIINASYNTYSRIYKGQITLGLPVSKELVVSQEEIRNSAVGKLALALYHIILRATGIRIPRDQIKLVIIDELEKQRLRMTENVILLNQIDLNHLVQQRFKISQDFLPNILMEAGRRRILKESLKADRMPAYFESEIEELEQNGRGNYEIVYYRDFTEEGKEIGFRRLVSMEDVTANDNRPALTLVPGFANNSNCFNINNRYSMAKDLADMGFWVYLFDPRGVGVNEGRFDPYYTIDSMIDYDLATVVQFIYARSHGKPTILLGHSMGGVVSENMILNWSLREHLDDIDILTEKQKSVLNQILPPLIETSQYLKTIRGVISLGSPKFFNRKSHLFFPIVLWFNHLSRIFRLKHVPIQEISKAITGIPFLKDFVRVLSNYNVGDLNFLISPENHKDDKYFIEKYLQVATESIPLGLGFQCLKAIYDGRGFKRMDASRLNYSELFSLFPDNIPVFHFWGTADNLASVDNVRYSELYPHRYKQTYHIQSVKDLKKIEIPQEESLLVDFIIEGANHIDLLYGKAAEEYINPIVMQIVEKVWGDWSYNTDIADIA